MFLESESNEDKDSDDGASSLKQHWIKIQEREGMARQDMIMPQFNFLGQYIAQ